MSKGDDLLMRREYMQALQAFRFDAPQDGDARHAGPLRAQNIAHRISDHGHLARRALQQLQGLQQSLRMRLGIPQLIGSFAAIWDDIVPPIPEAIWRENLDAVVASLSE